MSVLRYLLLPLFLLSQMQAAGQAAPRRRHHSGHYTGLKLGASFDEMKGNIWETSYHAGVNAGVFTGIQERSLSLQGELLVSTATYTYTVANPYNLARAFNVRNVYGNIPVVFGVRLVHGLWLQAGLQYSLLFSSQVESPSEHFSGFTTGDLDGVLGLDLHVSRDFTLGGRYFFSTTNIDANSSTEIWKRHTYQFYVGCRIW